MFKQLSVLLLLCFASVGAFAQTEKYTVPVKWERYKVGDKDVSVLLPKLPVLFESSDSCREQETRKYAVYTDQTVYGFSITSKIQGKLPYLCSPQKKFDEKNFQDRLVQLKAELKEFTETNFNQNTLTINRISGKIETYWLINDFENKRWFEFWVTEGSEEKIEVQNFVKSIEINKTAEGIEIGNGANKMLGDETVKTDDSQMGATTALRIIIKPTPRYTDMARQKQTEGTVDLKVSFLANGEIGNIEIVKALPYGLTEQAYAVARKIVFIPPRKNGTPYAVSKTVQYSFAIY